MSLLEVSWEFSLKIITFAYFFGYLSSLDPCFCLDFYFYLDFYFSSNSYFCSRSAEYIYKYRFLKATKLALKIFIKGQKYNQANFVSQNRAVKAQNSNLYYENLYIEC